MFYYAVRPYLTKAFAKQLARSIVFKIFAYSGIQGFLYTKFVGYFVNLGLVEIEALLIHWGIKIDNKEKTQKYEDVIKNPNATGDDVANAGHDLLNS